MEAKVMFKKLAVIIIALTMIAVSMGASQWSSTVYAADNSTTVSVTAQNGATTVTEGGSIKLTGTIKDGLEGDELEWFIDGDTSKADVEDGVVTLTDEAVAGDTIKVGADLYRDGNYPGITGYYTLKVVAAQDTGDNNNDDSDTTGGTGSNTGGGSSSAVLNSNDSGVPSFNIANVIGVPDDFANDLWTKYDSKEMKVGDTAALEPRRIAEAITNPIQNDVEMPNFHFEVIGGDSIEVTPVKAANGRDTTAKVTAKHNGISVVKITYDAFTHNKGKVFGASSAVNTAYVVYDVNDNPADVTITTSLDSLRSYDTIYFDQGDTTPYNFTVDAKGAKAGTVEVTLNGHKLTANAKGGYTANLQNTANVIGVTAKNAAGQRKSYYKVIDARKIEISIKNADKTKTVFNAGDTALISFKGISNPVAKLAHIYNPTMYSPTWGNKGTYVHYINSKDGQEYKGVCDQYNLDTKNTISVKLAKSGVYNFKSGKIFSQWWGLSLGSDKGTGQSSGIAPVMESDFCSMPDFTIYVDVAKLTASADAYNGTFDNKEHSIKVNAPAGSKITYSATEDGEYTEAPITLKEVGTRTVYYKVEKDEQVVTGSSTITITAAGSTGSASKDNNSSQNKTGSIKSAVADNNSSKPDTGDNSGLEMQLGILGLALAGLGAAVAIRRKKA